MQERSEPVSEDGKQPQRDSLPPCDHDRVLDFRLHEKFCGGNPYSTAVPHYTSDIEEAVRLCRHVLPGWVWRLCECSVSDDAWLMPDFNHPAHGEAFRKAWPDARDPLEDGPGLDMSFAPAGRPAAALCAVLLSVVDGLQRGCLPEHSAEAVWALLGESQEENEVVNV